MSRYLCYSDFEAAENLIQDQFQENIVMYPVQVREMLRHIHNSLGRQSIDVLLCMAMVNTLILERNKK